MAAMRKRDVSSRLFLGEGEAWLTFRLCGRGRFRRLDCVGIGSGGRRGYGKGGRKGPRGEEWAGN